MNAMYSDTAGLMLVCLGFEAVAMHRFVFQEMMSRPNNILRLDDKRVDQIVTVACKTGWGVDGVDVAELAELNLKLLVYYVKLCDLRSKPVVL